MGLDPSHQLTEKDIHDYQLPEKIGGKWRDLARALDYSQANINRIQKDQGGSTKECCIEVLVCWRGREGRNATVEKLAGALVKAELKNVADELMCMDTTQNDRFNMTISQMQTNCNCKHLEVLKEEVIKLF
ncbi:ankyrin-1-like [Orbicella faveolata]|uniref:ankyrin-1-like n=1 Tax=Orbicella faveolata TaxID=48498 RepID=UPI0009E254EF|nr:ankyrin-1-like [Orbicella faveolata]